ncbi:DUF58 domain-containing protein [Amnibacterium setariae]|uniref:DUF58 domain-containing protein n=1 Tax=Amnibacterium setariae TaxID=2306585 RepID=A0A3A1U214_9MICO|nr:DUF58 domain-containing protein [Amnibacterium setariae]RIX30413.1 DUF58 domain-containing protein [Amnibacterium setariae]
MAGRAELAAGLRTIRLTGRGGVFLGVAFVGLIVAYATGWPALLGVALFLFGAVVAAVCAVLVAPVALAIERRIDPPIAEQRRPIRVRVSVRGQAPGALEWAEDLPRSVVVTGRAEGVLPALRPDRPSQLIDYEFAARERGSVPIGPLRVSRTDPLGLATTRRRVGGVDHVVVLPRIHPVELPLAVRRNDPDTGASTVFGAVGDQLDIVARTYRSGDPLRTVDWRATARLGELMVRTEAAATTAATGLLLDLRPESWPESAAFEWAVDYAASLIAALDEPHSPVRLALGGRTTTDALAGLVALATVRTAAGSPAPEALLPALATADVQVVHVLTGAGGRDAARLPGLPTGALGMVSVVARRPVRLEPPLGWQVAQRDPGRAVGAVHDA